MDDLTREFITLVIGSAAVAAFSMTVTMSKVFSPFRGWVKAKSPFFGDLVSCPYCFSHWGSLIAVLLYNAQPVHTRWWLIDVLTAMFAMVALASVWTYIIRWSYAKQIVSSR